MALSDHDVASLGELFAEWGFKRSHAGRLLREFYRADGEIDLEAVELGKALVARLRQAMPLRQGRVLAEQHSGDGTSKSLIGFDGGGAVEAVLMPAYDGRRAAGCISSQIGCAMRCDFCASTRGGLERDLSAGEIVEQFLHLRRQASRRRLRLSTLVFMGMGEPLLNLENVTAAIRRIAGSGMGELGGRQITVSTVGIVPGMDKLADAGLNVHLALSLHAADDLTRGRIVPMNRKYPICQIVEAAKRFQEKTGRVVNIEYCLLAGVNDSDAQAEQLADLLTGFRAHVNLIAYNPIGPGLSGISYETPPPERVQRFSDILFDRKVVVHVRRPRGQDVSAACGQLRRQALGEI